MVLRRDDVSRSTDGCIKWLRSRSEEEGAKERKSAVGKGIGIKCNMRRSLISRRF